MKKILLFFWNGFFLLKQKIADIFYLIKDFFYTRAHKAPNIMTCEDTLNYILKNNCCVTRFGDAEMKLASGTDVRYQVSDELIRKRLREVIGSDEKNLLVCIPAVFSNEQLSVMEENQAAFWKKHLARFRKYWYRDLIPGKVYGDAFISRHYMNLKDKKGANTKEYFENIKKLWANKDVIIVEGEKSRLGMGNDLFDSANSVKRILAPSTQCFQKYDELLKEVKKHGKEPLYILALGPSATIMAYDLAKEGFYAIDMGNIDTEYEWFKMQATEKVPIKDKMVYEAGAGEGVGEAHDEKYLSQIIAKIL